MQKDSMMKTDLDTLLALNKAVHMARENSQDIIRDAINLRTYRPLTDQEVDVMRALTDRVVEVKYTVDYLTRFGAFKFVKHDVYKLGKETEKCGLVTYNQAIRLLDVVGACTQSPIDMVHTARNTLKDFLWKYRKGISPPRNEGGEPMLRKPEAIAAVGIASMRILRKYSSQESAAFYLMESCQFFFDAIME